MKHRTNVPTCIVEGSTTIPLSNFLKSFDDNHERSAVGGFLYFLKVNITKIVLKIEITSTLAICHGKSKNHNWESHCEYYS